MLARNASHTAAGKQQEACNVMAVCNHIWCKHPGPCCRYACTEPLHIHCRKNAAHFWQGVCPCWNPMFKLIVNNDCCHAALDSCRRRPPMAIDGWPRHHTLKPHSRTHQHNQTSLPKQHLHIQRLCHSLMVLSLLQLDLAA